MQKTLFPELQQDKKNDNIKLIGANLSLVFNKKNKDLVTLKNSDAIVKRVDLSDKPAKKLLIIEAVELGATKIRLANALNISRQTIDNYIGSKKRFGTEGLLGGYNLIRIWVKTLQNIERTISGTGYKAIRLSFLLKRERPNASNRIKSN